MRVHHRPDDLLTIASSHCPPARAAAAHTASALIIQLRRSRTQRMADRTHKAFAPYGHLVGQLMLSHILCLPLPIADLGEILALFSDVVVVFVELSQE